MRNSGQSSQTVDAAHAPSRESFFALYWDHVRQLPRLALLCMAKVPKERMPEFDSRSWDELLECEREPIRAAIMFLIECHDITRQDAARRRDVQGKVS